ncbi:MAG: undecaprenyldiphospho-muramoylpentapeptide beta-N-acetylglucosaminyltransferase [Candidatus Omnitrophica bacterium]|nr:undecaprenyldiphospho-muramoylpentapeptide beta-N-acetylglucosaminyltransferase [Candidatus Omnitrophota bacterium]
MRVLVITGASGGHIFPALEFLETLKARDKNIRALLVLPERNITVPLDNLGYQVNYISISPIKLSLDFKNIMAILGFIKGFFQSLVIILSFKPAIVVAFGSLASIPMVSLARVFGIKNLIHEQNVIPGRANRFLGKITNKIAISFPQTRDYFKGHQQKIALTGNPIRKQLKRCDRNKALEFFGFSDYKFTILVMGGSQGSHNINTAFLKAISTISDIEKIQIIHLTGSRDYDLLKRSYQTLNVNAKLFSFLESMHYAYSACDLVLSRAGATTIAEIMYFKLPAIIVPYPYARRHQSSNAQVLESKGCAIRIEDHKLHSGILRQTIDELINDHQRLGVMRLSYDGISRLNANILLVEEALSLAT